MRLAEIIASYEGAKISRHPVLNFAFARAGGSVIESSVLRMSEAVEPFLERAFVSTLGRSLFQGRNRTRRPISDVLHMLVRLRHEMVAHRVKLGGQEAGSWAEMTKVYGNPWRFLDAVFDEIAARLVELEDADYFSGAQLEPTVINVPAPFSDADVHALVVAANAITRLGDPAATV